MKEKMRNMRVKKKLVLYGCIMFGLVVLLGIFATAGIILMDLQTKEITQNWMPSLTCVKEIDTLVSDYRIKQYGHVTALTEEDMDIYERELEEIDRKIAEKDAELESYLTLDEELKILATIREKWSDYKEATSNVTAMSRSGHSEEAGKLMVGEAKQYYEDFGVAFDKMVSFEQQHTDDSENRAKSLFIIILVAIDVVIIVSVFVVVKLSVIMTALITEPLEKIRTSIKKISKEGSLDFELVYKSKDEFGSLTDDINDFVGILVTIIKDQSYLMGEMASGNFTVKSKIRDKYIGDFKQVLLAMRQIKKKLGTALSGIAESAEQVNLASGQLAGESQSLADGATKQTAAIDEVLETVERTKSESEASAEQAVNVSRYADDVKDKAQRSNEEMNRMVEEMNLLTETSRRISSIIDAIEDIASQTNLLSLNASIEAARAGEAGRGFAVVAGEIGKLAMQCSESASTTRNLIETAIAQTQKGYEIANNTAGALFAVSDGITQIASLTEEVKQNCLKQSRALTTVSGRMEEISQIVESNSASAEESSAASEELAAHADNLTDLLSEFQFTTDDH